MQHLQSVAPASFLAAGSQMLTAAAAVSLAPAGMQCACMHADAAAHNKTHVVPPCFAGQALSLNPAAAVKTLIHLPQESWLWASP